jgi:two-component system OmpR family response regulator
MNKPAPLKRILVVDDEMTYRLLCAKILRDGGYAVDVAADGHQALERLKKEHYDAALIDNLMPGLTGLELVKWMKTNLKSIPTLILTGYPSEEMKDKFADLNVAAYISKGKFEMSDLASLVKEAIK